jgi:F420-dependent oxidoreductase-like protein
MRLGVHLVNFDVPGGPSAIATTLARVGAAAETAGVANLSAMDHYLQIAGIGGSDVDGPMLEGYTTLAYLAAHTSTVELQLLVTGVTYRHPGLMGKIVTTLDVLSGGRAALGIGAAWYEREHAAYGVPFPPLAERFERLEETLQIVHQLWSDDNGPYTGRHYQLAQTLCSPRPLRTPRPPIMIGGSGEKKTLRLVAKYADATNLFAGPQSTPDAVAAKLDVLAAHCQSEGTNYDRIRKTILWTGPLKTDRDGARAFADQMAGYAKVGVDEVHVMPLTGDPVPYVEELGDHLVPLLADLAPTA